MLKKKKERQPIEQEKMFAITYLIGDLYLEYNKELLQLSNKKINNPIKN